MTHLNGATPEVIEADIARQREELAATVDELHHRLDVKAQVTQKAADLKGRATTDTGRPRPELAALVAVAATATIALVLWRRSTT
jgi:two-component sensor histidine kinase